MLTLHTKQIEREDPHPQQTAALERQDGDGIDLQSHSLRDPQRWQTLPSKSQVVRLKNFFVIRGREDERAERAARWVTGR